MRLRFLGTGTSVGVPQIGCSCEVCTSADPRDRRLRTSALVESGSTRILLDCGPDFRQQMLGLPFAPIDGVLLTHEHFDHVAGLDDLRPFCRFGNVPVCGERRVLDAVRTSMSYCFRSHPYPGSPRLCLEEAEPGRPLRVGSLEVLPFRVMHGELPILGFRIGPLGYVTDMSGAPSLEALRGVDTLVVNGLRHEPHATHQTLEEAVRVARSVGARRTWLVHLCDRAGLHARLEAELPADVRPAYDGLTVEVGRRA